METKTKLPSEWKVVWREYCLWCNQHGRKPSLKGYFVYAEKKGVKLTWKPKI